MCDLRDSRGIIGFSGRVFPCKCGERRKKVGAFCPVWENSGIFAMIKKSMNMLKNNIVERVERLRTFLRERGLDAFIFPSSDPHSGEYVPSHWKTREWISGFNGSAGTAVVGLEDAALWTDSRYFLAAEEQLAGTPFVLMKERIAGTPSIAEWLAGRLGQGAKVGMDGWVMALAEEEALRQELAFHGLELVHSDDPAAELWTDRPPIPQAPVVLQPLAYAGETAADKLERLRLELERLHAEGMLVSKLDEVAWLANIRGTDVHCCPVAVAYMWVARDFARLYVDDCKLTDEVRAELQAQGIACRPYEQLPADLKACASRSMLLDPKSTNSRLAGLLPPGCRAVLQDSPVARFKAVKNPTEMDGFRKAMHRDGVAMVKFLHWLKPAVEAGGESELSVSRKLEEFRALSPLYRGLSFDTIAGYAAHGAIVHYEADEQSDSPLQPRGLLLLDSGAQYPDGTTDITRTIALGELTEQECIDYTLVLRGHIRLAMVCFPAGSSGTQIDVCARYAMWQQGINYLHGTGHGVGSYLNVHEGPHQVRMNYVPMGLQAGMTVTNEPGIYRAGCHGVRIENTMLVQPFMEGEYGEFLRLEALTLCPIDKAPVIVDMMQDDEIAYLNAYHARVYAQLAPELDEEERAWLEEATSPICK